MKWKSEHAQLLMKRKDAIDLLPNVKPRKAKWLLDDIQNHFFNFIVAEVFDKEESEHEPYEINGISITESDFNQMIIKADDYWGETDYITPEGADILLRMYRKGCFELKKKSEGYGDTQKLEEYAASGEGLLQRHAANKERKAQQEAQELHWKEHPEELPEDKFTASRLNNIMWYHGAKGMHSSMEIGGTTVTKEVSRYSSNSGKSHDNEVILKWTGSDGTLHEEVLRHSSYQHNQRNDEDRNWGLPE
jgi:hypothetical protein